MNLLVDERCGDVVHDFERKELRYCLEEQLRRLRPQEEEILRRRFGLASDGVEMTLEEIGRQYSLTRERIRQIEERALKKLRHPARREKLEPFW